MRSFWRIFYSGEDEYQQVDGLLGSYSNFSNAFESPYFSNENCESESPTRCTCYNKSFDAVSGNSFFKQACCEKGLEAAMKQSGS